MPPKSPSHAGTHQGNAFKRAIVLGGMLAGALDLAFALSYYGAKGGSALKILQSIAAGLQGNAAYQRGTVSAALGTVLHFVIALGAAGVFCALGRLSPVLLRRPCISGAIFGAGVYYFMNLVVLPLSALRTKGYPMKCDPWLLGAHVFLIGVPIALVAHRCLRGIK